MSSVAELRQLRLAKKAALEAKRTWDERSNQDQDKRRRTCDERSDSNAEWGKRRQWRGDDQSRWDDKRSRWSGSAQDYSETNSMSSTSRFRESRSLSRTRSLRNGSDKAETNSASSTRRFRDSRSPSRAASQRNPAGLPTRGRPLLKRAQDALRAEESGDAPSRTKPSLRGALVYRPSASGSGADRSRSRTQQRTGVMASKAIDRSTVKPSMRAATAPAVKPSDPLGQFYSERNQGNGASGDALAEFWSNRNSGIERIDVSSSSERSQEDKTVKAEIVHAQPKTAVQLLRQKRLLLAQKRKEAMLQKQQAALKIKMKPISLRGRRETFLEKAKKAKLAPWKAAPFRGSNKFPPVSEATIMSWSSHCTAWHDSITEEGGLEIEMAGQNLDDDTMGQWCCWMATKLSSYGNVSQYKAQVVDFSDNNLGEAGTQRLMQFMEKHAVTCDVLKLFKNELNDEAVMEVAKFLTSFNRAPVRELHLSHNRITRQGVKWLLASLAMHPAYPRWCDNEKQFVPLWLRLEMNSISNAESVELVKDLTEELDISLCLVQEKGCCMQKCCAPCVQNSAVKHNCIAHLFRFVDDDSLRGIPMKMKDHTAPILADASIEIPWSIRATRQRPFIIYEDPDIACIFKPADWICTPSGFDVRWGEWSDEKKEKKMKELMMQTKPASLHAWIVLRFGRRSAFTVKQQFGLVHRLDRDTSGPVLVGKTDDGYKHCKNQIFARSMMKDYICLVHGRVEEGSGECHAPIDGTAYRFNRSAEVNHASGMPAISIFEPISYFERPETGKIYTLVHVRIVTGRTHQIRLHMEYLGHPLVGERKYLKNWSMIKDDMQICKRIFLHKYRIGFTTMDSTVTVRTCTLQMSWDLWNAITKVLRKL